MPLEDLLRWAAARRKTGSLVFEDPEFATTLFLKDGHIISSSSTDPRFYFGQFLLAHTTLTEEQLRRAFERQEKSRVYVGHNIYMKTLLGKVLVEQGLLSESEVSRVLRRKIEESIYDVFLWQEGTFRLSVGELPPEELVPVALEVAEVLRRGRERALRWQEIRAEVPSSQATFRVHPETIRAETELGTAEARLLLLLGEGRSVRELMLDLHTTEFAVGEKLLGFLGRGWITLDAAEAAASVAPEAVAGPPADELVERGLELFDRRAYADTVVAARQALRENPGHTQARRLLERSERELTDSFYARLFGPDDIPVLQPRRAGSTAPTLAAGALSAEERFLLDRVNGTWSIRSLVKLSPLKEVDALAVFKRLLEQGLIAIVRAR